MVSAVISGGQWGDEGKAKITDLLSRKADYIVRYQGGANAGHTVSTEDGLFKFHLIPSGILFPGKVCIIGPGTVIEPSFLIKEITELREKKINLEGLRISSLAHVTMPWHIALDKATDTVGSTGRGIGPTYTDKAKRLGIQMYDLISESSLRNKLEKILPKQNQTLQKIHDLPEYVLEEVLKDYLQFGEFFKPFLSDTVNELYRARKEKKNILFEGAQGTLLDITFGTYPYVTSSTPVSGGACIGAGVGPTSIDKALGVFKCFSTRVGDGPFPSELDKDTEEAGKLRQDGTQWAEFGTTTGRMRRVGWFDAVLARYAVRVNSFTGIALTKLDTLDSFDEINICVAYVHKETGETLQDLPHASSFVLAQYNPIFQTFPGWKSNTHKGKDWNELPAGAKNYVNLISEMLEVPVSIVSTGPGREHSIFMEEIF
ncbi:MAG: adenylosuccinate synthase [Candidatus Caenarcaniphilales bacterium]|nr:adenylosuccinate synthase [Candidatus Caenarcaniphilales bacterium]